MMKLSEKDLPNETASLREIQKYVVKMAEARNFSKDVVRKMLMLTEEIGELAKAVREFSGMKFDAKTQRTDLSNELADCLIVLMGVANITEIDLYDAFIAKEKVNLSRKWNIIKDKEAK